jgi:hypothetical protein
MPISTLGWLIPYSLALARLTFLLFLAILALRATEALQSMAASMKASQLAEMSRQKSHLPQAPVIPWRKYRVTLAACPNGERLQRLTSWNVDATSQKEAIEQAHNDAMASGYTGLSLVEAQAL